MVITAQCGWRRSAQAEAQAQARHPGTEVAPLRAAQQVKLLYAQASAAVVVEAPLASSLKHGDGDGEVAGVGGNSVKAGEVAWAAL